MKNKFAVALLCLAFFGCTSDEPNAPEVQPPVYISEAEEMNQWIFSQMKHRYFWNEDIPDSAECDFKLTPTQFYKSILSSKDRFSYITESSRSSDINLGFEFQKYMTDDSNIIYEVLYTTSHSAKQSGIKRGDFVRLNTVGNQYISIDLLENPTKDSIYKTIEYMVEPRSTSSAKTVLLDTIYSFEDKRIGYLCYLEFGDAADFHDAFEKFHRNKITDLILDLRYNPGGYVNTCRKLCSLIAPEHAYTQLFQQNSFNKIIAEENLLSYGNERTFTYFEKPYLSSEPTFGLKYDFLAMPRVYILTSKHTASASEATICCLKPYMDVTVIGETTVGKGVGMQTISSNKYRYSLVPITFRYYNSIGETVDDSGIIPDYIIEDSYTTPKYQIGDISERLLNKALSLIIPNQINESSSRIRVQSPIIFHPIGEPSYITEFNNKHYNEND